MIGGAVYILTNEAMPGLVKIGRTARDLSVRAFELFQTGVPQPFEVLWREETPDCVQLEAYVHAALRSKRCNKAREFFRVDPVEAMDTLRWCALSQAEMLLSSFSHSYRLARPDCCIDEGAMHRIAAEAGVSTWRVLDAIAGMTGEELRAALDRSFKRSPYLLIDDETAGEDLE